MLKALNFWLFIFGLILLSSCSKYQRLLKSSNFDEKYEAAVKYYEKHDYYRSLQLLEEMIVIFRGTTRGENVYYYYAQSHYGLRDYISAGYHFENFVKTFPASKRAEECAFLAAYCAYQDSPVYSLDQQNSERAIEQFQLFINHYPQSNKVDECNKLMDALRAKIETKAFNNAKTFFYSEDYKAAASALNNLIRDYPGTEFKEEAMYLILKSYYLYARKSIDTKKPERYKTVAEAHTALMEAFPSSSYAKQADNIKTDAQRELEQITKSVKTVN
jgi:outer membrane protein assembly factor BamD